MPLCSIKFAVSEAVVVGRGRKSMRSAPPSFLDTNILVYEWDDRDPKKQATARRLVRNVGKQGVISSQVLQEFASVMRSKLNATSRQIGPILGSYRAFGLVTIDFQLVEHSAVRFR